MPKPYNMNRDFIQCPIGIPVILTDEYINMYLGTVEKRDGQLVRGKCIDGDAELFYRNKIIGWERYNPQ